MKWIVLAGILVLVFGCINNGNDSNIVNKTNITSVHSNLTSTTSTPYQNFGSCKPGRYGTIETVGSEVKNLMGEPYEFCHTITRPAQPPPENTGTPLFTGSDNWYYQSGGSGTVTMISYSINRYTMGYTETGMSFLRDDGKTCIGTVNKSVEQFTSDDVNCG